MKKNKIMKEKLFEYALFNAWHFPISCVAVFDGECGTVKFGDYRDDNFGRYDPDHSADHSIEISCEALSEIKSLLSSSGLSRIKQLERPPVLDGYIQEFCLNNGKTVHTIHGRNMDFCIGEPECYPKAAKVISFFEKIAEILVSEGVEERYFLFSPENEYDHMLEDDEEDTDL